MIYGVLITFAEEGIHDEKNHADCAIGQDCASVPHAACGVCLKGSERISHRATLVKKTAKSYKKSQFRFKSSENRKCKNVDVNDYCIKWKNVIGRQSVRETHT